MSSDIQVNITVDPPLEKLARAYGNLELNTFLQGEIQRLALLTERYAKQVTPVLTGRLRASIHVEGFQAFGGTKVKTGTHYAIYVHEGTRFMRARPFMQWGAEYAVDSTKGQIGPRLEKHLRQKLSRL